MRVRSFTIAVLAFVSIAINANAQPTLSITQHRRDIQSLTSRDYWLALPQNYDDQSGKSLTLYISSTDSTIAHVQLTGGTMKAVPVAPGTSAAYQIPIGWEMKSSGTVEDKAIHVWSDDAALFVNFNSHNPYTSDATDVIPAMGWGKAYIVASYNSLYLGPGTGSTYDEPSEFVVIADQDSTLVTITPSADIRGADGSTVLHAAHTPFVELMNAGQSVQYKLTTAEDGESFDATGTQILATKPVGVIGATQCANIPSDYPYCDFICEMIPPVRTWGKLYYTAPLAGRTGGDTHLLISTTANQLITRTDESGTAGVPFSHAYDHLFLHDVSQATRWESDQPFLLVQYSNSATYPDMVNHSYDPFMMAVNAVDHFSTPVLFNVLSMAGQFVWHIDIVAHAGDAVSVDGVPLTQAPIFDDQQYAIYEVKNLAPKQHRVEAANGVSVSVYADGFDEAVGYAGMIGVSTITSPDTLAPTVSSSDSGLLVQHFHATDVAPLMSGLSHFQIDHISNMKLVESNFTDGSGSETGDFDLVVIDKDKAANASVRVVDLAGNYTTISRSYAPLASVEKSTATTPAAPTTKPMDLSALSDWMQSGSGAMRCLTPNPNPANTTASFDYAIRSAAHVTLDLYDILGAKVLSIVSGNEEAGVHQASADLRLVPAGSYIYRMTVADEVVSGKLTVSK